MLSTRMLSLKPLLELDVLLPEQLILASLLLQEGIVVGA
jgi:hypothetical protein